MRRFEVKAVVSVIVALMLSLPCAPLWAMTPIDVKTSDGFTLKMLRYRPTDNSAYRIGRQPVLLLPGIVMNMDQYLTRTPTEKNSDYSGMRLPLPLAKWAENDPYIKADPMKYYSLGHYLWVKGYDPWFVNYRDTGRGEFKSTRDKKNLTTLDVWANLDAPAAIEKVYKETGLHPVVGGHSTASLCSIAYLQGCYIDADEMKAAYAAGFIPHVRQDDALAIKRNSEIKGFMALDPAGRPPLPAFLDAPALWTIMGKPLMLDFDRIISEVADPLISTKRAVAIIDLLFKSIDGFDGFFDRLGDKEDVFGYMNMLNADGMMPYTKDFLIRYCLSSASLRTFSQYFQNGVQSCVREHWKNGYENRNVAIPENPVMIDEASHIYKEDGYYYYDQNVDLISVPSITILSSLGSMVSPEIALEDYANRKTSTSFDEIHVLTETGHADFYMGIKAPTEMFPKIGEWLNKVCPLPMESENSKKTADSESDIESDEEGSGKGMCFIASIIH